jgi:hypothetical protein
MYATTWAYVFGRRPGVGEFVPSVFLQRPASLTVSGAWKGAELVSDHPACGSGLCQSNCLDLRPTYLADRWNQTYPVRRLLISWL